MLSFDVSYDLGDCLLHVIIKGGPRTEEINCFFNRY